MFCVNGAFQQFVALHSQYHSPGLKCAINFSKPCIYVTMFAAAASEKRWFAKVSCLTHPVISYTRFTGVRNCYPAMARIMCDVDQFQNLFVVTTFGTLWRFDDWSNPWLDWISFNSRIFWMKSSPLPFEASSNYDSCLAIDNCVQNVTRSSAQRCPAMQWGNMGPYWLSTTWYNAVF